MAKRVGGKCIAEFDHISSINDVLHRKFKEALYR